MEFVCISRIVSETEHEDHNIHGKHDGSEDPFDEGHPSKPESFHAESCKGWAYEGAKEEQG